MDRHVVIDEVKRYFGASDHWRRLCGALQDPDPQGCHIHSYVVMSVHPKSIEQIITNYFSALGWPSVRKIDHVSPKENVGSLHGIEPSEKPHFDFHWMFDNRVGLRAA